MSGNKRMCNLLLTVAGMLLIIAERQIVANGISEGIEICLQTIIPSLFPFFIISAYLQPLLTGSNIPGLASLGRRLAIPSGQENILLLGLLGGYPVGAQLIGESHRKGHLSKENGQIMMGYCNHAGPSFLLGITSHLFQNPAAVWWLWCIHIISAIVTALLLPRCTPQSGHQTDSNPITLPQALQTAISVCARVCGWILLFKALFAIISSWFFRDMKGMLYWCTVGILELSNGCLQLMALSSEGMRFILCASYLAFGGLCIAMQAASVSTQVGMTFYFIGKIAQTLVSMALAIPVAAFLFSDFNFKVEYWFTYFLVCGVILIFLRKVSRKKLWKSRVI